MLFPRDDRVVEEVGFYVESSLGELNVRLMRDGWTSISFVEPGPDAVIIEDIVRTESDLAECFRTLQLPDGESQELAEELWDELDEEERRDRAKQLPRGG